MRNRIRIAPAILALLVFAQTARTQQKEFFADEEVDRIRDAQGLDYRIPLLLHFADKRLVALGLKVLTEKEKEQQKKDDTKLDEFVYKSSGRMPVPPRKGADPDAYLKAFSKAELLRGYAETLEDAMNYIEDAYKRKLDVRPSLERFADYTKNTRPLLDKFKPSEEEEEVALEEARKKTDEARDGAKEALETVPITEKKAPKP